LLEITRVIEDPGHGFAEEALAVMKKWQFKPATLKDGKPTKIMMGPQWR
jgi:hypothetical protein